MSNKVDKYKEVFVGKESTDYIWDTFPYRNHPDSELGNEIYFCKEKIDSLAVNIDDLLERILILKNKGATHLNIDFHGDHQEYELFGVKYEKYDI